MAQRKKLNKKRKTVTKNEQYESKENPGFLRRNERNYDTVRNGQEKKSVPVCSG